MKFWTSPLHIFDYAFNEVSAVFYDRYPNSFAKHIVSEDVIERRITENTIFTKKLVVKKGASFLKSVPNWMSRLNTIQTVPTLEESIYDRRTNTLITYTRNISHTELFNMDEKSVYREVDDAKTSLSRELFVSVNYPRLSSFIERVLVMTFRSSIRKTLSGISEKLEERFGSPIVSSTSGGGAVSQANSLVHEKATVLTDKLLRRKPKIDLEKA